MILFRDLMDQDRNRTCPTDAVFGKDIEVTQTFIWEHGTKFWAAEHGNQQTR